HLLVAIRSWVCSWDERRDAHGFPKRVKGKNKYGSVCQRNKGLVLAKDDRRGHRRRVGFEHVAQKIPRLASDWIDAHEASRHISNHQQVADDLRLADDALAGHRVSP